MPTTTTTADEARRLETLRSLGVLDTPADPVLDQLAQAASHVFRAPIALVSLVDAHRQWFKARIGLDATETPREWAFCAHAIHGRTPFVVADADHDPRFAGNPLVVGPPHVAFYAGVPLVVDDCAIGTLCVIDRVPRIAAPEQITTLAALARAAGERLELGRRERELAAARTAAERAFALRTRFLSTMSHELRTPMNGVLGSLDLLAALPLGADARELATLARDSGRRMMELLDDVLELARLQSKSHVPEHAPFDLRRELEAELARLRPAAAERGLGITGDFAPLAAGYVGDAPQLRQAVGHLVAAAVRFSARGTVRVQARVAERRGAWHALVIEVADGGPALDPATLEMLLSPFRPGEPTAARRYGGTGLGLALAGELATALGGHLAAVGTPGEHNRFRLEIVLPVAEPCTPAAGPPAAAARPATQLAADVLVVDDEPVNRLIARRALERAGCRVTLAADGGEALERAAERRYDLVLMDCMMPGLDGLSATARLRAGGGPNERTPVVALTANVLPEEHAACLAAGMDAVLTKPVEPAVLVAAVARHVAAGALRSAC
jgi:signal transduction histidine kinase/CheY-like chemotaxis protein